MSEIIPAGECGTFTITTAELLRFNSLSMEAFEVLVLKEAEVRGLLLETQGNQDGSITVNWRPQVFGR